MERFSPKEVQLDQVGIAEQKIVIGNLYYAVSLVGV
jgi:hypothetical protein